MDLIFDNIETIINASNAASMLFIGIPFFLIGLICILFWFWWRVYGERYEGKIAAVKVRGKVGESKEQETKDPFEPRHKYRRKKGPVDEPDPYDTSVVGRRRSLIKDARQRLSQQSTKNSFKNKKKKKNAIGGTIFIVLMLMVFFGIGAKFGFDYIKLSTEGYQAQGYIVDFEESYDSESGYSYYAVVAFADSFGHKHRYTDHIGKGNSSYLDKRNTPVNVYYDPRDPSNFAIADFWHNMLLPAFFMGIPLVIILFSLLVSGGKSKSDLGFNESNKKYRSSSKSLGKAFSSEMYFSVFEYTDRYGERHLAHSQTGSNSLLNKVPGTPVTIFTTKNKPNEALRAGNFSLIFGLIFLIPGALLSIFAFRLIEFNTPAILILSFMFLFFVGRIAKKIKIHDKSARQAKMEEFKKRSGLAKKRDKLPELTTYEVSQRLESADKTSRQTGIVFGIIGLAMIIGSFLWAQKQTEFYTLSGSAVGYVESVSSQRSSSSSSDSGTVYYTNVVFNDERGRQYKFRDSVGTPVKLNKAGDQVNVMYDVSSPHKAYIDRGLLNYFPQLILGGFGVLFLLSILNRLRSSNDRRYS